MADDPLDLEIARTAFTAAIGDLPLHVLTVGAFRDPHNDQPMMSVAVLHNDHGRMTFKQPIHRDDFVSAAQECAEQAKRKLENDGTKTTAVSP